jgi:hypothetical protein
MTIAPLTPAAAPVPTTGAAAGSNTAGDFLAEMLQALAGPVAESTPGVAPAKVIEEAAATPATPATPAKAPHPPVEPVETPEPADETPPDAIDPASLPQVTATVPQAAVTPVVVDTAKASPRFDKLNERVDESAGTAPRAGRPDHGSPVVDGTPVVDGATNPGKHLGTVANPGLHLGVDHVGHPVNPKHAAPPSSTEEPPAETPPVAPRLVKLDDREAAVPASVVSTPATTTLPPATATAAPVTATLPATTPTVTAPAAISDQVFGEITGLTSRGNGTHRITMKLQPEALGEVRVVLTVRDGAVHVRLAAGQEARAALLDGSPELRQLLEHAGATETRIVVRELPASAVAAAPAPASQPAQQTPTTDTTSTPVNAGLTGDRSPDRHAGTRADHLATDGDDTTRGHRTGGRRDVTPIRSVTDSRTTAVDLTM